MAIPCSCSFDHLTNLPKTKSGNLDIDGDGSTEGLTDGLLLLHYLFGFDGLTLIEGAMGENTVRTSASEIRAYIELRISEGT
jgi:hypothetical protein